MSDLKDRLEMISYYKRLASSIRENITARKRPLIVEFSGLPKAGKTTVVNSLALFLRRNRIPTVVVTEQATVCPVQSKEHPDFNIWTACTSLTKILSLKQRVDNYVIVVDRGIFDAVVWMNLLNKRGKLNSEDLQKFKDFFLLERWRNKIDLVICMHTSIEKALEREFKDLLTDISGSIMNEDFLGEYLDVMNSTANEISNLFNKFIMIDTTNTTTIEGVEKVISEVIKSLEELSDEKLVTIPRKEFTKKLAEIGFSDKRSKFAVLERLIKSKELIVRRSEAEQSQDYVQIIVCTIITYQNKIAIVTKKEKGSPRFHDKKMIWIGGHLQNEDFDGLNDKSIMDSMKCCLRRELEEELEIDYDSEQKLTWRGIVYDNTHQNSLKHLGVVFQIDLKEEFMMKSINNRTFMELSGKGNHIEFIDRSQEFFSDNKVELEPWSVDILESLYKIKSKKSEDHAQTVLF